jgi:glycosyltransferase involved in cell wall biosynthesis
MKILVHQENLFHYRLELLNRLGDSHDLTVFTSNNQIESDNCNFTIIRGFRVSLGKFVINLGVFRLLFKKFDKYILLPNFFYPFTIILFFLVPKSKRILWGCDTKSGKNSTNFRILMAKVSRAILQYNENEREKLLRFKLNPKKIFVANNTVHVPNAWYDETTRRTSLLYVGRLQRRKKIEELLKAFSELDNDFIARNDLKIEIVGDGNVKDDLLMESIALGINQHVIFHGRIDDHKILKKLFSRSYAYVSPDAIGLGLQHSFAYGVPVITSKYGFKGAEFFHLEDHKNCILWSGDGLSLKDSIQMIMNKDKNRELSRNCFSYYNSDLGISRLVENFEKAVRF